MEKYDHKKIEAKWQKIWAENADLFSAKNDSQMPKKYILDMFPYPSGDGLHVGHVESYTATDIISRYSRMKGMNVLHPQGWDAFGLPAENYAIKTKIHPMETTKKAIANFKGQMNRMGFSYDWSREICSADPEYYKWTQWFFLLLYKNGLAYRKKAKVNWCESCQTVLANEQAEGGICERCKNPVIQKDLEQWFFKITDFVEKNKNTSGLLDGLDKIDWPESTKAAQKNWIGKSEGSEVEFKIIKSNFSEIVQSEKKHQKTTLESYNCNIEKYKKNNKIEEIKSILDKMLELISREDEILEIGSGLGLDADYIESKGFKVKRTDAADGFIKYQRSNNKEIDKFNLFSNDYLKQGRYKVIYSSCVFHHFSDVQMEMILKYLAEYNLTEGGILTFTIKSGEGEEISSEKIDAEKYYKYRNENEVRKILERNNFEVIYLNAYSKWIRVIAKNLNKISSEEAVKVYTTRLDTIFGCTFVLLAPEHGLLQKLKSQIENWDEVKKYITESKKKSELQRISEIKEKTGVEIKGIKVINPFTGEEIPLFASDFILGHYGTGAVMAVPAHDERDFEFAKKYNLPITEVIKNQDNNSSIKKEAFIEEGVLINSGEYDGLKSAEARQKMTARLEKNKLGSKKINYKLRDWLVSRQRYWGAPIPIIYCEKCGEVPVPEKDLPVMLPDDVDFVPTGESPLAKSKKFHDVKCPICGGQARRESDTMDTFVCSSWYYLRYSDPKNEKEFAGPEMLKYWLPVDLYVGGAEHSVLHLLYARFFTKVLHSLGYVNFDEPFLKLRHQGIILAEDGNKMSKSLGNVINPDEIVEQYGADALRMFEMFMGPLEAMKPWNTKGINGVVRFLERTWNEYINFSKDMYNGEVDLESRRRQNKLIKKITDDIESFKFNTAIASFMEFFNYISVRRTKGECQTVNLESMRNFLILLSPFAPHISEELWLRLGNKESIFKEKWPEPKKEYLIDESVEMVVQINGKVRGKFTVASDILEEEAKKLALADANIQKWLGNKEPQKIIFVKGKLLSIVI